MAFLTFIATPVSANSDNNSQTNPIYTAITDGTDLALVDGSGNLQTISAANDGVDIGDVDVTSVIPGTGATNLGKAVDDAAGATDTGVASLFVRDDTLTTLTPIDGDYVRGRTNDRGALWVAIDGSITANNDSVMVDDSAFTVGTDSITMIGGYAGTDSVDANDGGALRMLTNRALVTTLEDAGGDGVEISANGLEVDITGVLGSAISETNPVPVNIVSATSGQEIHDYDTATVAGSATDNHDYTASGGVFIWQQAQAEAIGPFQINLASGTAGAPTTFLTYFLKRNAFNAPITFAKPVEVADTDVARIQRINRLGSAQDVASTIIGSQQ